MSSSNLVRIGGGLASIVAGVLLFGDHLLNLRVEIPLSGLAFLVGLIMFGVATMRAGVFPRSAGILLIVGCVVFGAARFLGSALRNIEVVGILIICAAFVWLGSALLSGGGAPSGQPARVTPRQVSRTLRNMGDWLENRSSLEIFVLGFLVYVVIAVIVFLTLKSFIDPRNVTGNHYVAQDVGLAMAGVAGALGVFFTWRSLRQTRASTQRTLELTEQGQITERFTRATDQLGATNDKGEKKLEIRLGGIYALERIARNSESDYWTIMDILAAYVREQASQVSESDADEFVPNYVLTTEDEHADISLPAIVGIPRPSQDIAAALQVLARRVRRSDTEEENHLIDLDGISLTGKRLTPLNLEGVSLSQADLSKAYLMGANFASAYLFHTKLEKAFLHVAVFKGAWLAGASFKGARLEYADLEGAFLQYPEEEGRPRPQRPNFESTYLQHANLKDLNFQGANLRDAHLHHAKLEGTDLEKADLQDTHLQHADLRRVDGLTQEQINRARGDETTRLPDHLRIPTTWRESTEH